MYKYYKYIYIKIYIFYKIIYINKAFNTNIV